MKHGTSLIILTMICVLCLLGCATVDQAEPVAAEEELPATADIPVEQVVIEEETVESPEEKTEFIVTEEVYTETFDNIKSIIKDLNSVIASRNYDKWLEYLTADYIDYYSNPEVLDEFTRLYKARGYDYRINNLKDYFNYLVVISRSNAVLDDIIFIDQDNIKAMTRLKGQLSVLYYLERVDNVWKIGLKSEN